MTEISRERIERARLAVAELDCGFLQFSKCTENLAGCVCRDEVVVALTADAAALAEAERRGRIAGLREAATIAGTMAERPYDDEPEFGAVMHVEDAILARLAELEAQSKETPR